MPKLQIGGQVVQVGDEFNSLSPEDQQKTVNEIAASLSGNQPQNHYDLADVPEAALKNAPADAKQVAVGLGNQALQELPKSLSDVPGYVYHHLNPVDQVKAGYKAAVDTAQHFKQAYGSWDQAKTSLAEHPVQAALDAASVLPVAKGLKAGGEAATGALDSTIDVPHPEVHGNVAQDLTNYAKQGQGLDSLPDVKTTLAKAHEDYLTELNTLTPQIKENLGGDIGPMNLVDEASQGVDAIDSGQPVGSLTQDQLLARQALKSSRNLAKSSATPEQIDALSRVAGDTPEGARVAQLAKQIGVVQNLRRLGEGGVSQYTDRFNPINHQWMTGSAVYGALAGQPHFSAPLVASGAIYGAGRAIDALTGNRIRAAKWLSQNAGVAPQDLPVRPPKPVKTLTEADTAAPKDIPDAPNTPKPSDANLDENGNPIKNQKAYNARTDEIKAVYSRLKDNIDTVEDPDVKQALTDFGEQASAQARGKTPAAMALRNQLYLDGLNSLKLPSQKELYAQHAAELKNLFKRKKL